MTRWWVMPSLPVSGFPGPASARLAFGVGLGGWRLRDARRVAGLGGWRLRDARRVAGLGGWRLRDSRRVAGLGGGCLALGGRR